MYPSLLLTIDEARALPLLFELFQSESKTLVRWAYGRAFRNARDATAVRARLLEMTIANAGHDRRNGVELCSWQVPICFIEDIRRIAISDNDSKVRGSAESALRRRQDLEEVQNLLTALKAAHGSRCWSYVEAIISLGDPWIIQTPADPHWIGRYFPQSEPGLAEYAGKRLELRRKELLDEAEKVDRKSQAEA